MKATDLKFPFSWEERRPLISDRVLYIPKYYDKHADWALPGWEDPQLFGRLAPLHIEYCAGNGGWIIDKALQHPEINWIAVEKRFERVRKIWSKIHNFQIKNLFVVCGEALTFTQHYIPTGSFDAAFVNFPDPWPKEKHAKNRLLQDPFFSELARACKPGAPATIVTDHFDYAKQVAESMHLHAKWKAAFPPPFYVNEWANYGSSYFGDLWKQMGLAIYYMQFTSENK